MKQLFRNTVTEVFTLTFLRDVLVEIEAREINNELTGFKSRYSKDNLGSPYEDSSVIGNFVFTNNVLEFTLETEIREYKEKSFANTSLIFDLKFGLSVNEEKYPYTIYFREEIPNVTEGIRGDRAMEIAVRVAKEFVKRVMNDDKISQLVVYASMEAM